MPVNIEILNDITTDSREYEAAICLKTIFENESILANSDGNICIGHGLTLYGQKIKDVDLLVFGELKGCVLENFYTNDPNYRKKNLRVINFCTVIELKEHVFTDLKYENTHIFVTYNGQYKDATQQNEDQKYSVINHLRNQTNGNGIFVTNFVWLKSLSPVELKCLTNEEASALSSNFSFTDFISVITKGQKNIYFNKTNNEYEMCSKTPDMFGLMKKSFAAKKIEIPEYTRRKLEKIAQIDALNFVKNNPTSDDITILRGKAGTGKTFLLLQYALHLSNPQTKNRCLLLTYNHALVNDIRRLINFLDIPDGIENHTIQITTLHSFFESLMKILHIKTSNIHVEGFREEEYLRNLGLLKTKIDYILQESKIEKLKDDISIPIDWDYILVDEAQDWHEEERDILVKVYGKSRIIVADGGKQMLRNPKHLSWGRDSYELSVGKRQKSNIVSFLNTLAEVMEIGWKQKNDNTLVGGKVIIKKNYDRDFHIKMSQYCQKNKCDNYDILMLVPSNLVLTDEKGNKYFKNAESMKQAGVRIFDGTRNKNREQYSTDANCSRLYQYDSCRGLEGWVVVCMQFDVLLENKKKIFKPQKNNDSIALQSDYEQLEQHLWMWIMLSFTRAVDTLVITIKDTESEIAKMLHKVADKLDFVEWAVEND